MAKDEYVKNFSEGVGVSLGLQYKYRLLERDKDYVIFDCKINGKVIKCFKKEGNEFFVKEHAMNALFEVNGVEKFLDGTVREEMDL